MGRSYRSAGLLQHCCRPRFASSVRLQSKPATVGVNQAPCLVALPARRRGPDTGARQRRGRSLGAWDEGQQRHGRALPAPISVRPPHLIFVSSSPTTRRPDHPARHTTWTTPPASTTAPLLLHPERSVCNSLPAVIWPFKGLHNPAQVRMGQPRGAPRGGQRRAAAAGSPARSRPPGVLMATQLPLIPALKRLWLVMQEISGIHRATAATAPVTPVGRHQPGRLLAHLSPPAGKMKVFACVLAVALLAGECA